MGGGAAGRAVIFDLDGTLADTLGDIADCLNACLAEMGERTRREEEYPLLIGDGLPALCRKLLADPTEERIEELRRRAMERYSARLVVRTRPFPGVPELLERLRAAGVPMAVLSNKPEPHTRGIVARLFAPGTFAEVFGHCAGRPRKPDPGGALELAGILGVPPERCVLVGDSGVDMRTARAAGMQPLGVTYGFRSREELLAEGARRIHHAAREILPIVLGRGAVTPRRGRAR